MTTEEFQRRVDERIEEIAREVHARHDRHPHLDREQVVGTLPALRLARLEVYLEGLNLFPPDVATDVPGT